MAQRFPFATCCALLFCAAVHAQTTPHAQTTTHAQAAPYAQAAPGHAQPHDCGHDEHDSAHLRETAGRPVVWQDSRAATGQPVRLKILGFNDFHGALERRSLAGRPVGGADVLAAYLAAASAEVKGNSIVVHAGDHVGASPPASALLQDEPSIQFLNLLGNRYCRSLRGESFGLPGRDLFYSLFGSRCNLVGTLGNHEFDEGVSEMLRLIRGGDHPQGPFLTQSWRGAGFPYITANVVDTQTQRPILPPFTVLKVGGVEVGFIGAVLRETPTIVTPAGVAGVTFLDEADSINKYAKLLKKMGVRTLVVTIHQGARQTAFEGTTGAEITPLPGAIGDIVQRLHDEIDVVVTGHAHGFTNQLATNKSGAVLLVTQAFSAGTAYADIDLTIDRKTGDLLEKRAKIVTTWADEGPGLTPDAAVAALVADAVAAVAPRVSEVVGDSAVALSRAESTAGESALGNLIADAQRSAMASDVAFMNPGGIRADLDAGQITWGDLFAIQPFANDLVQMELTGAQILTLLNQQWSGANAATPRILKTSGITYTWDLSLPAAERVRVETAMINGEPLSLDARYKVTVNSFMASGGDNFTVLTQGVNRVVGPVDLAALVQFVQTAPQPVNAAIEGRIRRLN